MNENMCFVLRHIYYKPRVQTWHYARAMQLEINYMHVYGHEYNVWLNIGRKTNYMLVGYNKNAEKSVYWRFSWKADELLFI